MGTAPAASVKKEIREEVYRIERGDDFINISWKQEVSRRACGYDFEVQETNCNSQRSEEKKSQKDQEVIKELVKNDEMCRLYYKEHNLDSAMVYVRKLRQILVYMKKTKIEKQLNIGEIEKFINQIEIQYNDMVSYDQHIKEDGWIQKYNKKGIKISTKRQEGTVGVMVQSVIDIPFQVFISVLIQMNLYNQYVPFVKVSRQERQVARNSRIGYTQMHFPILTVRQAFFEGIGYNRLHHDNSLFLFTRSIHNRKDLQEKLDYECQINKDFIQLQYKYLVVKYEPIDKKRGKVTLAMNVDIKLNFIPMWIQDKVSQDFGEQFFTNIMKLSKKFEGSKWEKNVKENPELFNFFKKTLEDYMSKGMKG